MSFIGVDLAIPTDTDMNRNPHPRSFRQTTTEGKADPPPEMPIKRNVHKSKNKKDRSAVSPNEAFTEYKQDPVFYALGEEAEIDDMAAFVPLEHESAVGRLGENDYVFVRRSGGRFCFALIKSIEPDDENGLSMHLYVNEVGATKSIPKPEWINYIRPAKQYVLCNPSSYVQDLSKDTQDVQAEESQQKQRSRSRGNRRASCPEAAQDANYIHQHTNKPIESEKEERENRHRGRSRGNRRSSCPEAVQEVGRVAEPVAKEREIIRSQSRANRRSSCPEGTQDVDHIQNFTNEAVESEVNERGKLHRSRSRGNRRSSCPEAAQKEYVQPKVIERQNLQRRTSRVGRVKSDEPKKNSKEYDMVKNLWMRQSTSRLETQAPKYAGTTLLSNKSNSNAADEYENDSVVPNTRPIPVVATEPDSSKDRNSPHNDYLYKHFKQINVGDYYAPKTTDDISGKDTPNERQFSENTKDTAYSSLRTNPTTGHMSGHDGPNERQFSENTRDTAFSSLQSNLTAGHMNCKDAPNDRQFSENTRDTAFSSLQTNLTTGQASGMNEPNKRQFSENTKSTEYSSFKSSTAANPANLTHKSSAKSNKQIINEAIAFATSMQTNAVDEEEEESRHVKWDIASSQGQSAEDEFPMPDNTVPQFRPLLHRVKTEHESDRRSELAKQKYLRRSTASDIGNEVIIDRRSEFAKQKHLRRSTASDIGNDSNPSKGHGSRRGHSRRVTVGGLSESQQFDQSKLLSAFASIQPKKG